jgi:hypothetical protein
MIAHLFAVATQRQLGRAADFQRRLGRGLQPNMLGLFDQLRGFGSFDPFMGVMDILGGLGRGGAGAAGDTQGDTSVGGMGWVFHEDDGTGHQSTGHDAWWSAFGDRYGREQSGSTVTHGQDDPPPPETQAWLVDPGTTGGPSPGGPINWGTGHDLGRLSSYDLARLLNLALNGT